MNEYYIVSVLHTQRRDRYITLWRPENKGYAWPLPWAGKYSHETVTADLGYYNTGTGALAVRTDAIESLGIDTKPGTVEGNAGPVIPNTKASWAKILVSLIDAPRETPKPQYRGAPK